MTPLEVACAHQNDDRTNCGAAAGEPCRFAAYEGAVELAGSFHAERLRDAAGATAHQGLPVTDADFERAVLATGLF